MQTYLRIVDWNLHYENNRTRELKKMEWVPIPNRMDGSGYTALLDHPDGPAHFGAWVALVEIASRTPQPYRGWLVRVQKSQEGAGIPQVAAMMSQDLARISRMPAGLFDVVIGRLLVIGWIEKIQQDTDIPQEGAEKSQEGAGIPQVAAASRARAEGKGREGSGMEANGREARASDSLPLTSPRPKPPNPDEPFREYIGVFLAAGKGLCDTDVQEACREWVSANAETQAIALVHIKTMAATTEARFLPMPVNHLRKRPWTRTGPGRLMPAPKTEKQSEFDRLFDQEFGGAK